VSRSAVAVGLCVFDDRCAVAGVEPPIIEKPLRSKVMKDVCPHKW